MGFCQVIGSGGSVDKMGSVLICDAASQLLSLNQWVFGAGVRLCGWVGFGVA